MIIDVHAQLGKHPLFGFEQTAEEIVADMQRYGIDKSFLLPVPRMRFAEANNAVANAVKKYKGKFVGFLNVNPSDPTATKEIDRAVRELGLKGLMLDPEFHFTMERPLSPGNRLLPPLFEKAVEYNLPVIISLPNIRAGHLNDTAVDEYDPLDELAQRFPEVRILADIFWPRLARLARAHSNLYVDTAGCAGGRVSGIISGGREYPTLLGATHVMFGSNSPRYHAGNHLQDIRWAKLTPSQRELVTGKNAERVFADILD